ncbi:hypothetical protein [Flavobacterium sp. 1355]|uniref:hypothetical protein n=1 Tax=Flavobacterium sp. 1355 TaxID=2806571 RepID=UPI001AE2E1B6|nr:hypothetical protein [Flavobacterium sp. 1355]MBP1223251.1 uncharacterized protein YjbI with pentapeptide repeats [Flavobacterium sp. 1355]
MEAISGEEFQKIIYSDYVETISDLVVEITKPLNIDLERVNLLIIFSHIKFSGKQIQFYKNKKECLHRLRFEECIFESNMFFESDLEDLTFISNTFTCDRFHIRKSTIGVLEFSNHEFNTHNNTPNIFIKGNFKIYECSFDSNLWLKNAQFLKETSFDISSVNFFEGCYFDSVSLDQIMFYNCNFSKEFRYDSIYNISQFKECSFTGLATFSGLPYLNSSFLWFENCHFSKLANFNNYWLHKLRIEETTFSDNVSFQQTYFDIVCFIRIIFEKKVWFDDIRITKIDECDRITIRTIKQELQKAENRIDFNKFRNYELAAHYKELNFKIDFKDKTILWATKWSSNFGSWTWAFWFTIIIGLIFFTPFFIFENFNKTINLQNWQDFIYGYFRFFLITDFKNEYYKAGESLLKFNCFLSLFPFLFGKITIAFGIYEMIQSFRKFKA